MTTLLLTLLALAGVGQANGAASPEAGPTAPVEVVEASPVALEPGGSAMLGISVRIAPGHRVQANPASHDFLVPLEIRFDPVQGFRLGEAVYPEGKAYRLKGTDEELSTYVGSVRIVVPVIAALDAEPGRRLVTGKLFYQACTNRNCLFPSSIDVTLIFVIDSP